MTNEAPASEPAADEAPSFPMAFHPPLVPGHVSDAVEGTSAGPIPTVSINTRFEAAPEMAEQVAEQVFETTRQAMLRPTAYAPAAPSEGPLQVKSPYVRIKNGQVGIYSQGNIVPTAAFPDLKRLFDLGVVEWADQDAVASEIDPAAALAITLSRPVLLPGSVPRAPWVQAAPGDLMGPAVHRQTRMQLFAAPAPAFQTINVAR